MFVILLPLHAFHLVLGFSPPTQHHKTRIFIHPSSENEYLVSLFDVGSAITVKALVPLSCYWTIVSVVCWTGLAVTAPLGYRTEGGQELARHLYFNILEVAVLCVQLVS